MDRLEQLDAVALPIPVIDCDTDQIIPARYLQKPRSANFGDYLFRELRFNPDGSERPGHLLNQAPYRAARIVVANRNFACGSSREHAVWALYDYGIRAVVAPSFGDIFFINSLKNGLLPIVLPEDIVAPLLETLLTHPGTTIHVDLPAQRVTLPDGAVHRFDVEPFAKRCLMQGMDEIDYTLAQHALIDAYERKLADDSNGSVTAATAHHP